MPKHYRSDHHNDKFPQGKANPGYPGDNARKGASNRGIGGENQDDGLRPSTGDSATMTKEHREHSNRTGGNTTADDQRDIGRKV